LGSPHESWWEARCHAPWENCGEPKLQVQASPRGSRESVAAVPSRRLRRRTQPVRRPIPADSIAVKQPAATDGGANVCFAMRNPREGDAPAKPRGKVAVLFEVTLRPEPPPPLIPHCLASSRCSPWTDDRAVGLGRQTQFAALPDYRGANCRTISRALRRPSTAALTMPPA